MSGDQYKTAFDMNHEVEQRVGRPGWVWAMATFYFATSGWRFLTFFLVTSGSIPLDPTTRATFHSLTTSEHAISMAVGAISFCGAMALLLLRKIAFYLFATQLALIVLVDIWKMGNTGSFVGVGGSGVIRMVIDLGLAILVCIYSWSLMRKDVLT